MDRPRGATAWGSAILLWLARLWSVGAALVLIAFLAEHLTWFRDPNRLPPASVYVAQIFQLLLIVGLLTALRWDVPGALLTLFGATGFLVAVGGGLRVLAFISAMSFPAVLWLGRVWLARRGAQRQCRC